MQSEKQPLHEVIGIDGCRCGWVAADLRHRRFTVAPTLAALWEESPWQWALIDIPLGLLEYEARGADRCGKKLLGSRASSVFMTPCRAAVYAGSYEEANALNRQYTGRGISKQAWNLCPKIREAEAFRRAVAPADVLGESHPELCFAGFNRGVPAVNSKKSLRGLREREKLLQNEIPGLDSWLHKALEQAGRGAGDDDLIDSLALAAAAQRGREGLLTVPEPPQYDAGGLPIQLWYPSLRSD